MRVMLVLSLLLLATSARACSLDYSDPSGDTSPQGLLGQYDLIGINVTSGQDEVIWNWRPAALAEALGHVQYTGQIAVENQTEYLHPICKTLDKPNQGLEFECHLSRSRTVGAAVQFEFVSMLNWSFEGGGISTRMSWQAMGVSANDTLLDLRASAQTSLSNNVSAGGIPVTNGNVSPTVTDNAGDGKGKLALCEIQAEALIPGLGPTDEPASAAKANLELPLATLPWIIAVLGLASFARLTRTRK